MKKSVFAFFVLFFIFILHPISTLAGAAVTHSGGAVIYDVTRSIVSDYTINAATLTVDATAYCSIQVVRSASGTVAQQTSGNLEDLEIEISGGNSPEAPLSPLPVWRVRDRTRWDEIDEAGFWFVGLAGREIPVHHIRLTFQYKPRSPNNHPYKVYVRISN